MHSFFYLLWMEGWFFYVTISQYEGILILMHACTHLLISLQNRKKTVDGPDYNRSRNSSRICIIPAVREPHTSIDDGGSDAFFVCLSATC